MVEEWLVGEMDEYYDYSKQYENTTSYYIPPTKLKIYTKQYLVEAVYVD